MKARLAIVLAAAVIACGLLTAGCGGGSAATGTSGGGPAPAEPSSGGSQGSAGARLDHIAFVVFENTSYDDALQDPAFGELARRYGLASRVYAIQHPSLPNYLAMTGGSTFGVNDDAGASAHPISGPSIFSQVRSRGLVEGMPSSCSHTDTTVGQGGYSEHHNPYIYYTDVRSACEQLDVPYSEGQAPDLSAPFTFVVPDKCHDAHNCPLAVASGWLEQFLGRVRQTPQWRNERTAVVVTFDEDDHHEDNHIYTVVMSNQVHSHVEDDRRASLYTLLGTTEDLLGVPRLRAARGAGSIADLFVGGS